MRPSGSQSALLKPYFPAFDGLRAVAFFMVFACHYVTKVADSELLRWGWVGTDLFFALSGFLITGILYDSFGNRHYFRTFYIRRSLRIFPLFYSFWLLLLLLTPVFHILWNRYNLAMAAYIGNIFIAGSLHHPNPTTIIYHSIRHPGVVQYLTVGHLWTLCVEEQFYLVWPAVVFLIRSRRTLLTLCLAALALLPLIRLGFAHLRPDLLQTGFLYNSTWSHSDALLAGASLALWLRGPCPAPNRLRLGAIVTLCVSIILIATTISLPDAPDDDFRICTYGFSLVALASVSFLVIALSSKWLAVVLETRPMIATGRITYGLYFFHALPILFVTGVLAHTTSHAAAYLVIATTFVGTYAVAWCSYRFLEAPFLRLKSRFAVRPNAIADPPADPHQIATLIPSNE
jgi:peptidoglycan/LPS O-acetylase OafA/YrhL